MNGRVRPCCDNNPVDCKDNVVALRSRQDLYAVAIPLNFKYTHEARPLCQKDALWGKQNVQTVQTYGICYICWRQFHSSSEKWYNADRTSAHTAVSKQHMIIGLNLFLDIYGIMSRCDTSMFPSSWSNYLTGWPMLFTFILWIFRGFLYVFFVISQNTIQLSIDVTYFRNLKV